MHSLEHIQSKDLDSIQVVVVRSANASWQFVDCKTAEVEDEQYPSSVDQIFHLIVGRYHRPLEDLSLVLDFLPLAEEEGEDSAPLGRSNCQLLVIR